MAHNTPKEAPSERQRLLAAVAAQAVRQAALLRLSADLGAVLEESEVCRRVVYGLHDTLGYDFVALFLVDPATGDRVHAASAGAVEPPARIAPGEGLSERPLIDGQLHYTPDVGQHSNYIYWMGGSEVDVPIRIGGTVQGVLIAESRQRDAFDQDDFEVLTAAVQQAGLAIGNARLLAAERARADELDALRTTMAEITAELELSALLQAIVERAAGLVDASGGELGLYDATSQEVRVVVSANLGYDFVGTCHKPGEGAMGRVAESGEALIIADYDTWAQRAPQYADLRMHAVLAAPLKVGSRLVGIITLATTDPDRQFNSADLHLLALFGQQAAIAIENAQLYEKAQQEIAERLRAEEDLRQYQEQLEERVAERTAELQASEERYRSLFDGVPVGLYRTTPSGRLMDANLALVQIEGYPDRDRLLAADIASMYVSPEDRVRWQALMEEEGVVRDFENQVRKYDGTVIWVNDSARVVKDEQGRVLYYEGSIEDITERKQAEDELHEYREHLEELVEERTAELRESEARYRTLFDGVPVGLYRTTPTGHTLDMNLAAVQMFGFPSREDGLTVETPELYVDPEARVRWQRFMEREGVVRGFEAQLYRYDGTVMWVSDTARMVTDEQGQALYYEGSLEDITQRKQFEEEIRRQKDYLEALFDNSPVAVVTADLEGKVVSWNPMAETLFGYAQEEAIGTNLEGLVAADDSIREEAAGYTDRVLSDMGRRVQATTKRTRKDGSLVDVELLALPLVLAGEKVGFCAIYHDISELKAIERELRQQKDYFEALFVNSPVAVVTGDLEAKVSAWNPMAETLFGYTREEAIGSDLDELVAADDSIREEAVGYTERVRDQGRVQAIAQRTRKDGSLVQVELLALPLVLAGEKVGFYAMYHDISERVAIERELRRQKEYYEALFINSPVAVVTVDRGGDVISWNPTAEQLFGYTQDEAIGENIDDLVARDDSIRAEAMGYTEAFRRDGHIGAVKAFPESVDNLGRLQVTTRRTRKDGSLVEVELLGLPVMVAGEEVAFIMIYHDISEREAIERELRQQKDYFEALFVNSPVAVVIGDLAAQVVSWNPMAETLFGFTQEEAIGTHLDDLVAADDSIREEAVGYRKQVRKMGRVQATTKRTRKDGSLVDVELLALPLILAGEEVGFYAMYHDISERVAIERELRHQKEYYEALFVNSPVAVVTVDRDGNVLSWNPAAEQLFGYTQDEAIGRNVDGLIARDDSIRAEAVGYTQVFRGDGYVGAMEAYPDLMDDQGRLHVTTKRTRKDGSLVEVELSGLPVIVSGEEVAVIAIYHDISGLKAIERELRHQKEYYEALFVNSPVAVVTVDREGHVVSWNPAAEQLFGYKPAEAIGQDIDSLVARDDSIRAEAVGYTEAFRMGGHTGAMKRFPDQVDNLGRLQVTTKRTRKDGSFVEVEWLGLPVMVGGEEIAFIAIYHDIGPLQEARREAEAANQAKSTFLANMSHELRTPLNAILGFAQLMDGAPNLSDEQRENLGIINRSGEHLLALINDVLEMSKIEAGQLTLREKCFDLHGLLDGLEEMFRLRAEEKGLTLSFRRAEDVPHLVTADEGKLRQVLSNLLGNAVKFTQEGGVALRVAAYPGKVKTKALHFEVEDTGPGIAPEELERVFDPFVQAVSGRDVVSTQAQEGTGLGLSISKQFARLMGGDISVSSELGQGSLFRFDVEIECADQAEVEAARSGQRVLGLAPDQIAPDGGPYRLLVVEDREANRRFLVRLLMDLGQPPQGFEVREATNGLEALEIWEHWDPHLIWMDMRMPVMDGHEATQRIKAMPQGQSTVIVALTATAFEEDRETILLEGCDDFVRKPFRKEVIYDMLAKYLGVCFVYEEREVGIVAPDREALSAEALAAQPSDWLVELRAATIKADMNRMLELVEQIRGQNASLADALEGLIHNFEYKRILTLIEQAGGVT